MYILKISIRLFLIFLFILMISGFLLNILVENTPNWVWGREVGIFVRTFDSDFVSTHYQSKPVPFYLGGAFLIFLNIITLVVAFLIANNLQMVLEYLWEKHFAKKQPQAPELDEGASNIKNAITRGFIQSDFHMKDLPSRLTDENEQIIGRNTFTHVLLETILASIIIVLIIYVAPHFIHYLLAYSLGLCAVLAAKIGPLRLYHYIIFVLALLPVVISVFKIKFLH